MRPHVHHLHPCARWRMAQHYVHILVGTAMRMSAKGAYRFSLAKEFTVMQF